MMLYVWLNPVLYKVLPFSSTYIIYQNHFHRERETKRTFSNILKQAKVLHSIVFVVCEPGVCQPLTGPL